MQVWLDDTREAPAGFIHTKTAQDTIDLLKTGKVKSMSLDHDLGDDEKFGTGYDVARWVEQHAFNGTLAPLEVTVHSANPVGAQKMRKAIESAERFWARREKTANNLNKKFLRESVGYKFYTVNEEAVRDSSLSHEEFTDFATHLDFPDMIPEGEVWLAENTDDRERRLHATTALRLLGLVRSGLSKDEAYDRVLQLEKAHREKLRNDEHWDESKRNTNTEGIRSKRLGIINVCGHDIEVYLVNGDDVRDTFKTDFVEGGHGYVYPWIPENEVWLEENLKEDERVPVLKHELYELGKMMNNMGYEEAHLQASQVEFEERQHMKKAGEDLRHLTPHDAYHLISTGEDTSYSHDELEEIIAKDPEHSCLYAKKVIKGPWSKGEDAIARSTLYAYEYAHNVLNNKRFEKGEEAIAKNATTSSLYAQHVLKKRFEQGEPVMFRFKNTWKNYVDWLRKHDVRGYTRLDESKLKSAGDQRFASSKEALQYLADMTQRRVIIAGRTSNVHVAFFTNLKVQDDKVYDVDEDRQLPENLQFTFLKHLIGDTTAELVIDVTKVMLPDEEYSGRLCWSLDEVIPDSATITRENSHHSMTLPEELTDKLFSHYEKKIEKIDAEQS